MASAASTSQLQRKARTPRGVGFDLSGRQARVRREENYRKDEEEAEKQRESNIGDWITVATTKSKSKKGRAQAIAFGGQRATSASNEDALPSRHDVRRPRDDRRTKKERKPKESKGFDATANDFGPSLGGGSAVPKPTVVWGAHLNRKPEKPKAAEEPKVPEEPKAPQLAQTPQAVTNEDLINLDDAAPAPEPTTTEPAKPTLDVWGAEDSDEEGDEATITPGQAWGDLA